MERLSEERAFEVENRIKSCFCKIGAKVLNRGSKFTEALEVGTSIACWEDQGEVKGGRRLESQGRRRNWSHGPGPDSLFFIG